jgi:hypothetical protein
VTGSLPSNVTDVRSNPNDQIAHAAGLLRRSLLRRKVFLAIYAGKQKVKTVSEIMRATHLNRVDVLHEGRSLADNGIVSQIKVYGETAYAKDRFYAHKRAKIISLASDKNKLAGFPTKISPKISAHNTRVEVIRLPRSLVRIERITIDDIGSFSKLRHFKGIVKALVKPPAERMFKVGFQRIVREPGKFTDWGGERSDLFTTRLRIGGRRRHAAIAFKGKGLRISRLTPRYMGKNGDQIQNLFTSPAEVFLLQYWRQIDPSVIEQMEVFAKVKSLSDGRKVYFGIIDGDDSVRLMQAYPKFFK